MSRIAFKSCLGTLALLALTACGGNIGVKSDFKTANFEVGRTTRDEVVQHFGLPQKMVTDKDGRLHYLYEGAAHLVGMCIGCGQPTGGVGLVPMLINQSMVKNGAEYVFDTNQRLVAKFEPQKGSK